MIGAYQIAHHFEGIIANHSTLAPTNQLKLQVYTGILDKSLTHPSTVFKACKIQTLSSAQKAAHIEELYKKHILNPHVLQ